jgi:hypothetical protein
MTSVLASTPSPVVDPAPLTIRRAGRTLTLRPAPPREPPFDDEPDVAAAPVGRLDRPLPFQRTGRRVGRRWPLAPLRTALPDPAAWGWRLLIGVIEIAGGRRPLPQLAALLSASVAAGLSADFERAAQRGRPHWTHVARVRSVRATQPADGVAELSATLLARSRVRAVAMRLEVRHGRWCCTRLLLG